MTLYNIDEYNQIAFNGMTYVLPDAVTDTITLLGTKLGIVTTNDTFADQNKNGKHTRAYNSRRERTNNTWDKSKPSKPFKTTTMVKKEGIDKLYTDIKGCLNKLSVKNYDTIKTSLFEYIEEIFNFPEGDEDSKIAKIASLVFDISCINKTFSELYAKLYNELVVDYPLLKNNIQVLKTNYINGLDSIQYVDPDVDYSKYCDVTKENDKRKSLTLFLVNLFINGLISKPEIFDILKTIQTKIITMTDMEDKSVYIEELIEVLFVCVKSSYTHLQDQEEWCDINTHIQEYSSYKAKDHASISSRVIFKYMDMKELLAK